jgi:hypothetical protein
MLNHVTAVRFDRRMSSGKTWPCLLGCASANEQAPELEVVTKFSGGCERKVGALVAEAIAALLAADLDLPVPEPLLVDFDSGFAELVRSCDPALGERIAKSAPVAFGSTKLPPGFTVLPQGSPVPQALRREAAEVLAFDALIQNPDRRRDNPNCLLNGRSFAIFDHELAFLTRGVIGWKPLWQLGSLDAMIGGGLQHLFFQDLKGTPVDLNRLEGAWRGISDARLAAYRRAIPLAWADDGGTAGEALDYIAQVRNNIDLAVAEVVRIPS